MRQMLHVSGLSVAQLLTAVSLLTTGVSLCHGVACRSADAADPEVFSRQVQPLFGKYCVRCHGADQSEAGVRVDQLSGGLPERQLFLWEDVLEQLASAAMPPEDQQQPSAEERRLLVDWIQRSLESAQRRQQPRAGSVRRLTVAQYRNTLRDLLGLEDDLTYLLPPDAISKDGFTNGPQTLELSPLQLEAYFDIARTALDSCLVDEVAQPVIQNFRVDLGASINPDPCPDKLILGANSLLLDNSDFSVTELTPEKPFAFQPLAMRTSYRFIEGYEGNATVRGWREFDSIYHAVFACLRGTRGYPKGQAYQAVPAGLLLRPAIPSSEIFQESSTYGPHANFKISLRELPKQGNFRVTVSAARYDDALLLDAADPVLEGPPTIGVTAEQPAVVLESTLDIPQAGIYQLDVAYLPDQKPQTVRLQLGQRFFPGQLAGGGDRPDPAAAERAARRKALLLVRIPDGPLRLAARCSGAATVQGLALHLLPVASARAARFLAFERRVPQLGVHLGLRRDCGSTLARVGRPRPVAKADLHSFAFEGAIRNFPSPGGEQDNVNYLQGIREIGVRSEYTDGRDMPRLLVRSVEFEGPYYDTWPPATQRRIFFDSQRSNDPQAYAREVITAFATRAFRRPLTSAEETSLLSVWKASFAEGCDFSSSVKDALLVVLTSPQFLFLIEASETPKPEDLTGYELAAKLSYFLWNTMPDRRLLQLAAADQLPDALDAQVERMVQDPRFGQFLSEFTGQWLSLDKFDVLEVDQKRYPKLTRDTKAQLRREPIELLRFLFRNNLPLVQLIRADFVMSNDVVAGYYGLVDRPNSGFRFVPVLHHTPQLGGLLTQAGILAGLSDGRESNPVKRGAWLARKIIAEPPADPPPNVPQLEQGVDAQLTLRERLERHRNQPGCAKCHAGIDPWGLPFESFDAGGLRKQDAEIDARSTLPDGTRIEDLNALKAYLANERLDQVAFCVLKHLTCYAIGRSLSYTELASLRRQAIELKPAGYRLRDLIRFVVSSDLFLKK